MYSSSSFRSDRPEEVESFIRNHPFAHIIGYDGVYPVATQVPVLFTSVGGIKKLTGHFKRNTSHHEAMAANPNVLVIFNGPHAYISASVYQQPSMASTWNYQAVQVKGTIRYLNEEETLNHLGLITDFYEDNILSAASFRHLDNDYLLKSVKAIQGFEILIETIDHIFKLSQNHSPENQRNIISELEAREELLAAQVAAMMKENICRKCNE